MENLKQYYENFVVPKCIKKFDIKNICKIPQIVKIQINMGLGLEADTLSLLNIAINELREISAQHPKITKTKKAISKFKTRQNMPIGLLVTLRKDKMYSFLAKLIHLVFPRIRDFNGLNEKQFDSFGNYNFGISEQIYFPEIDYSKINKKHGFNISIITNTGNIDESLFLLKELHFPFTKV
jgi:large subunit ribosomal protein L5